MSDCFSVAGNDKDRGCSSVPRLRRDLLFFYFSLLFFSLALGLYNVFLPAHIRNLGATPVQLGLLGSLGMAISTLAALPGGWLTDRYDRKRLMLIGWVMCIPVPIIFSLAKTWQWLIPGYVLYYLSMFSNTPMQAYIADKADPNNVSSTFTIVFSSFSLGSIVSPALGGWLTKLVSLRTIFLISFVLYSISTLFIWQMSPNRPHAQTSIERGSWRRALRPELITHIALFTLVMLVLNLPLSFVTPYMQDVAGFDLLRIGLLGSLASLGAVMLAPVIGRIGDRRTVFLALGCSLFLLAIAYSVQLAWTLLPTYALAFLLRGASGSLGSLMTSHIGKISPREALGMSFAFYNLATSLGSTVAPYVAGQLYSRSPSLPFVLTVALAALLATYFLLHHRRLTQVTPAAGISD